MKIISVFSFVFFSVIIKAQENIILNLESVLQMSGAQNLTIQKLQAQQALADAAWTKSKEWWLPNLYAGVEMHQLWGGAMNADGRFFLDVNRNNIWNGIGMQVDWNFAEGIYAAKAQHLKAKAAQFETQAQRNQLVLEGVQLYYSFLLAQMNQLVFYTLEQQADSIALQVALLVQEGLTPQSDHLMSKSQAKKFTLQRMKAENEKFKYQSKLIQFLHLNFNTQIFAADSTLYPLEWKGDSVTHSLDVVFEQRPELKALAYQQKSLQQEEKQLAASIIVPTLSLDIYGSYFGKLSGKVRPMFPDQFPNPKQLHQTAAINASLKWNIPLGKIFYKGDQKMLTSKIKWMQLEADKQKDIIHEEWSVAQQNLIYSQQSMEQSKEALNLAAEALSQITQRMNLGMTKPYEIFQAQEIFAQMQLTYWEAVVEFNTAQFTYLVAVGINL